MTDQTKIMADQFKFQKELEAHAERKMMFALLLKLSTSVTCLVPKIESAPFTNEAIGRIDQAWIEMGMEATACWEALATCAHLESEQRSRVISYLDDIEKVEKAKDLAQLKALIGKHKGLLAAMKAGLIPTTEGREAGKSQPADL